MYWRSNYIIWWVCLLFLNIRSWIGAWFMVNFATKWWRLASVKSGSEEGFTLFWTLRPDPCFISCPYIYLTITKYKIQWITEGIAGGRFHVLHFFNSFSFNSSIFFMFCLFLLFFKCYLINMFHVFIDSTPEFVFSFSWRKVSWDIYHFISDAKSFLFILFASVPPPYTTGPAV